MSYRVQGTSSDGETFYVDGSALGRDFESLEDAIAYAGEYARAVGSISFPVSVHQAGWYFRATKPDGYSEDIRIVAR